MTTPPPPIVKPKSATVFWLIEHAPPPKPLCFDSRRQWQAYLEGLADDGVKLTRRQDHATWTTVDGKQQRRTREVRVVFDRVDYCSDCQIGGAHQLRMQDDNRCILPKRAPVYRVQIALFDATTDTATQQRAQIAHESARARSEKRAKAAAAVLRDLGWVVIEPGAGSQRPI